MIEFYIVRRVFNLTRDILFCYFYLNTVDQPRRTHTAARFAPCILLLLYAMFGAEDGGFFEPAAVRLAYRGVCLFLYLILSRKIDWKLALYDSLLVDSICIIGHNLFLTPLTRPILLGTAQPIPDFSLNPYLCLFIVQLVMLPLLYLICRLLPLHYIPSVNKAQTVLLITVSACSLYLNSMLRLMTDNQIRSVSELSIFSIILQFTLLMCLILMEQSQFNLRKHAAAEIQLSRARSTLEIARNNQQANAQISKIHHDLKNHIHSLRFLLNNHEYDKAESYLDRIQQSLPTRKPSFHTGNLILDSLLTEKVSRAEALGAEVMIAADLSVFSSISDFDLCTIFGNILDNALEACAQVPQPESRYIHLRSQTSAGFIVFTLTNSYEGARLHSAASFRTTKPNANHHGYGLSNVRAALEKHGGVLIAQDDPQKHEFQLSIMLPQQHA